ncbi:MAG: GntR family transcriptional regulator [Desulfarculaceae bacterium]|nr:GntR family transcriptional regulator [Desulfarculaceae bacterium]MCF8046175.1 GntR family transcriptional regulator [Desulfarculaceae bacterium]MCF8066122.1 GntR family transcriptional regulator [Desulfarculaceae bacterium]MCF8098848.1 GntR family transcriptional regulator [Desulfarculaceae bacterium]MCF8124187.1 GntR family transcriptional regulator [Desulfarculaceae bacterium]
MKNSQTLVEKAYQQIKLMLLNDELVAGQKLRYQDIAKRLDMSQTPVNLALVRLENEELVHWEANKGYSVPELDLEEARELYELRVLLEGFLVAQAALRVTDDNLAELRLLLDGHRSVRGEVYCRERLWCDARIHMAIARFSGHKNGVSYLHQLFDRIYLRYRPERLSIERLTEAEQQHEDLFKALTAHDVEQAKEVMTHHISMGQQRMLRGIRTQVEERSRVQLWG